MQLTFAKRDRSATDNAQPVDELHIAATALVADWNGVTRATIDDALAAGNPYVQLHYRRALKAAEAATTADTQPSIVTRLAEGYFSRHPIQGMVALFLAFVLACTAAPAFELLLGGM